MAKRFDNGCTQKNWFALYPIDEKIDDERYCNEIKRGRFRLHPKGRLGISAGCIVIDNILDFSVISSRLKSAKPKKIKGLNLTFYGKVRVW